MQTRILGWVTECFWKEKILRDNYKLVKWMEEDKIGTFQTEGTAFCKNNQLWEYKMLGDLQAIQLIETRGGKSKVRLEENTEFRLLRVTHVTLWMSILTPKQWVKVRCDAGWRGWVMVSENLLRRQHRQWIKGWKTNSESIMLVQVRNAKT